METELKNWPSKFIVCLIAICAFEFLLSQFEFPSALTKAAFFQWLVALAGSLAPVINNIDLSLSENYASIRLYLSLTLVFALVKSIIIYKWHSSNQIANYLYFVTSPRSAHHLVSGNRATTKQLQNDGNEAIQQKPRSMFSQFLWSLVILALTVGHGWAISDGGSPTSESTTIRRTYAVISGGGANMFGIWALVKLNVLAIMVAASACILRDYSIFLYQLFFKSNTR